MQKWIQILYPWAMISLTILLHFSSLFKLHKTINLKLKVLGLNPGSIYCYWMFDFECISWFLWTVAAFREMGIIVSVALRETNEIMNLKVFRKLQSFILTFVCSTYIFSAYFYAELPSHWMNMLNPFEKYWLMKYSYI